MPQRWFYTRNGTEKLGPVDTEALHQLIAAGNLFPDDLVWTQGMSEWQRAGDFPEFFAPAQPMYAESVGTLGYQSFVEELPYAGFWLRVCAAVIDGIIVSLGQLPIQFALGVSAFQHHHGGAPIAQLFNNLSSILIYWLYESLQESSKYQATLGKRVMNIVVTDELGQPLNFARATGRHFGKFLSAMICMVGYMMAGWTEKKQALHDMIAHTLVVKKPLDGSIP